MTSVFDRVALIIVFVLAVFIFLTSLNKLEVSASASDNVITMKYVKDQNGNCYASGPTVHEFSWIPCELTK